MTLRELIAALWRRKGIVLVAVLVSLGAGAGIIVVRTPRYQADSQVLLRQLAQSTPGDVGLTTVQRLNLAAQVYAKVASTPEFVGQALTAAGVPRAGSTVTASNDPNTPIVKVSVRAGTPVTAVSVARAIDRQLDADLQNLQSGVPFSQRTTTFVLQEPSARKTSTSRAFVLAVTLVVGLAVGVTVALLADAP